MGHAKPQMLAKQHRVLKAILNKLEFPPAQQRLLQQVTMLLRKQPLQCLQSLAKAILTADTFNKATLCISICFYMQESQNQQAYRGKPGPHDAKGKMLFDFMGVTNWT